MKRHPTNRSARITTQICTLKVVVLANRRTTRCWSPIESAQALTDPVCGMTVTVDSPHVLQHEGKPVYFCSSGCKAKFAANPAKYQVARPDSHAPTPPATERTVDGAIYTCPMHPQIRQVGPGNCPICGMTLEPVTATAEVGPNHELADMTRRFWVGSGSDVAGLRPGNGWPHPRSWPARSRPAAHLHLDSICSFHAGRSVGRVAILRTRLGIGRASQPEHVQP